MQIIELDVDVDHRFYCPVTGQLILAPEDYSPSPATAFCLPPEAEDFCDMRPDLREVWEKVLASSGKKNPEPWELLKPFCEALEQHKNLVVFAVTSYGMTCGPVCSTVYLCIDFAYRVEKESEEEA